MRLYELTKRELDAQKLKVSKDEWDSADDEMKSDIKSHNRSGVIQDALEKMDGGIEKLRLDLDNKGLQLDSREGPYPITDLATLTAIDPKSGKRWQQLPGEEGNLEKLLKYGEGRQLFDIAWSKKAKELFSGGNSGIYIWTHPEFGIFYVGIVGAELKQRWSSHIQKIMGRLKDQGDSDSQGNPRSRAPKKWIQFSKEFLSPEGSQMMISDEQLMKELGSISVSFYPINRPEGVGTSTVKPGERGKEDYKRWKKGLEAIEKRIVRIVTAVKMNRTNPSKMRLLNDAAKGIEKELVAHKKKLAKMKQ